MTQFIVRNKEGFPDGMTSITHIGEAEHNTDIHFGILKLKKGETLHLTHELESAYLLIQGKCLFMHDGGQTIAERKSCFDEEPYAIHFSKNQPIQIKTMSDCEFAVSQVSNSVIFPTQIFGPDNLLESEKRGKGILDDTACRIVRTIFDTRNRPQAKLVLGEVITAPGRWSSYPPHHHPHPEIYHYRFTEPQGYGYSECGEDVYKVRQFDTYKILNQHDHAQTSAPGYGMYYIWVIRHLDDNPYISPEFTDEHNWTRSPDANNKVWRGEF